MIKKKKKKINYIDNEKFLEAIIKYQQFLIDGKEDKRLSNYIGDSFYKLATHISTVNSFRNYPFKEDMISDAVFYCIKYIDRYDPEKTKNPYGYFTKAIYRSFLQRIMKEKKYLYTKYKVIENAEIFKLMSNNQEGDEHADYFESVGYSDSAKNNMEEFVRDYEAKLEEKRKKNAQ